MDPNFDPALTRPLSPKDFQVDTTVAKPVSIGQPLDLLGSAGVVADETQDASDRLTLQTALNLLRDARARAASPDRAVARAAEWDIVQMISYLAGLCDARGWISPTPPHAGISNLTGAVPTPSLPVLLDQFDTAASYLLAPEQTRRPNPTKIFWLAVGDAVGGISASLVAGGIVVALTPQPV